MKKLFILTYLLLSCLFKMHGQTFNGFPLVSMSDATNYSLSEMYSMSSFSAGYFYCHFYVTKEVDVEIDHCGSDPSESNMSLLNASGYPVALSTPYNYKACGQLAGLKAVNLPPGDYYIGNDFPTSNSSDYINISIVTRDAQNPAGNRMSNAINVGTHSNAFSYSNTLDTNPMTNDYPGRSTKDVYYTFTLASPMDITLSHCGSALADTYISLLNSSGTLIASNNDHSDTQACSNTRQAYLKQTNLAAGVYYVVSEGYTLNGSITTRIEGTKGIGMDLGDDHNYIITRTYTNDAGTQYLDNVQYLDGIGRPVQSIQRKITPSGKDLVMLQEYDAYGRESNTWLPGTSTGDGRYVSPETVKSSARTLNADQNPYSRQVYEASSLERVLEQYGPGTAWHTNSRRVKADYFTNISGNDTLNCVLYTVPDTSLSADTLLTITRRGYYPTGSLHVTRTADEDGNTSFEFKDKLGQVVLTRQIVRSGNTKVLHDTYYIYDDYGNQTAVLSPLASDAMKGSTTVSWTNANSVVLRNYAYLYKYDHRNRCKAKRLPGGDWTYYIYDTSDRLIFSQDGEQRRKSPKEWAFTITDAFNRVCLTGTCTNTYNALATTPALNGITVRATRNNTTGTYRGYTISGVTPTNPAVLSVNYYDDYDFLGTNNIPANTDDRVKYTAESGYDTWYGADYTSARKSLNEGRLTGMLTVRLSPDGTILSAANDLYCVMYYDSKGRLVQSKSNNHLTGGTEKEYYAYSFTGQILKRKHVHAAMGKSTQTEVYTYTYDAAERLTTVKHKLNTGSEITIAANTYDELGRLKTTQHNGVAALKSTYTYNVRSWMKSISSTLFTQTLYYNDAYGSNTVRYNGNISAMSWKLSNESKTRGYRFTYDNLSRLTAAGYLENGTANSNFNTTYAYDKHGNMTSLMRRGNTGTSSYGIIDNLTMTYAGNQLIKVEDSGASVSLSASMDFKNGSSTAREYYYNRNGNLTKDANKGISSITYNILNLPGTIVMPTSPGSTSTSSNLYTYAADGEKLSTSISGKTTDYCGSLIYENGTLKRILIESGYIEIANGGTSGTYHFYLTDHLGNNRVVANASGTIVQTNHYYPYGMSFAEGTQTSSQPFKFGGKELDTQKGLNWYDFEARWKDDWSFPTPDPHSESYYSWSPYAYCGANPILRSDPTGMDWYVDKYGNYFWQEGEEEVEGYTRVGNTISIRLNENSYFNAYQNAGVWANKPVSAFDLIAMSPKLQNQFLGKDSPLSENSKSELYNSLRDRELNNIGRRIGETIVELAAWEFGGAMLGKMIGGLVGWATKGATAAKGEMTVYRSVTAGGVVQYVGITNNFLRRSAEHWASKGIVIRELIPGISKADARAIEQALIEIHGLGKNGGTLLNKINSISPKNPVYAAQLQRGLELLKSIKYKP
ncbi:DUF6443 domain-containing protein [Bacteroides sp. UBA939]|uniref:DUF6443 domain-containing protein n=1 Tax=Bacteroides sp. UBA939 TaxID=1946092 RepID=UPI0025BC3343|nr:DUF6443 domain-containing protein [Bacteroides sp. UBA939]